MIQTEGGPRVAEGDDELDVIARSRTLQRKLVFWRRTAGLLFGLALVVLMVLWQRAELHRKACQDSLTRYAKLAQEAHLEDQPSRLLEAQWEGLGQEPGKDLRSFSPQHYSLIIENWGQKPLPGESLPLAVCRDPHLVLFAQGRYVLFLDSNGYRVEWLSEEQAAPIVAATRAEKPKR